MRGSKLKAWSMELGACCLLIGGLCGCASSYSWRPSVPPEMRAVNVPTFRNESDVQELGAIATRQLLREIQREGTFKIRNTGEAAIEIQGVVKSASASSVAQDRRSGLQINAYGFKATVEVSVVDKRLHKVLINNLMLTAEAPFTAGQDRSTAMRDASGRAMDDLSRQIVDRLLGMKWEKEDGK